MHSLFVDKPFVMVYVDDLLIHSSSLELHIEHDFCLRRLSWSVEVGNHSWLASSSLWHWGWQLSWSCKLLAGLHSSLCWFVCFSGVSQSTFVNCLVLWRTIPWVQQHQDLVVEFKHSFLSWFLQAILSGYWCFKRWWWRCSLPRHRVKCSEVQVFYPQVYWILLKVVFFYWASLFCQQEGIACCCESASSFSLLSVWKSLRPCHWSCFAQVHEWAKVLESCACQLVGHYLFVHIQGCALSIFCLTCLVVSTALPHRVIHLWSSLPCLFLLVLSVLLLLLLFILLTLLICCFPLKSLLCPFLIARLVMKSCKTSTPLAILARGICKHTQKIRESPGHLWSMMLSLSIVQSACSCLCSSEFFACSKAVCSCCNWLVGPLPLSANGNNFILILVDLCTCFVLLELFPNKSAFLVASALFKNFTRFGFPQVIQSDNGTEFVNALVDDFCALFNMKHRLSLFPIIRAAMVLLSEKSIPQFKFFASNFKVSVILGASVFLLLNFRWQRRMQTSTFPPLHWCLCVFHWFLCWILLLNLMLLRSLCLILWIASCLFALVWMNTLKLKSVVLLVLLNAFPSTSALWILQSFLLVIEFTSWTMTSFQNSIPSNLVLLKLNVFTMVALLFSRIPLVLSFQRRFQSLICQSLPMLTPLLLTLVQSSLMKE